MAIEFQSLVSTFKLKNSAKTAKFIQSVAYIELHEVGDIQYIFCSDQYLLKLNKQYLKHTTLTDIITFDYADAISSFELGASGSLRKKKSNNKKPTTKNPQPGTVLNGDIFISIERVGENAKIFKQPINREVMRVMIHGVLHLCGYKDKLPAHKKKMRAKEDYYLAFFGRD